MLVLDLLHKNRILEGRPLLEHQLLTPLCEDIALHLEDIIEEAGRPVQFLYFPIDSAISMTNVQDHEHGGSTPSDYQKLHRKTSSKHIHPGGIYDDFKSCSNVVRRNCLGSGIIHHASTE